MIAALSKSRKALCLAVATALVLAVVGFAPAKQAYAATTHGFQFSLLANKKFQSSAVTKTKSGQASAQVKKEKTNTIMLKSCGAVLRVHRTSDGQSVSDSATFRSCGVQGMNYWSGLGKTGKTYRLWAQVATSAGNTGTRVGGLWVA